MADEDDGGKRDGSFTMRDKLMYQYDRIVSTRGGQFKLLVFVCITFVVISAAVQNQVNDYDYPEALWESWLYMADPGVQSGAPPNLEGRLVALFISLGGIVFFAIIVGFVVDAIQEKMEALKKGRSNVVESGHTVMLGWTPFSVEFILEVCDANSSEGGGVIVVLADMDKEVLETEFWLMVKKKQMLGTKIVFRSGNPMMTTDLVKVSVNSARSILCLAPVHDEHGGAMQPDTADAMTLRSVLALRGLETSKTKGHIVAEVRDVDNEKLILMVGGPRTHTVVSHDVIGRLMLMSARQPGLAKVFSEILGFDGDEFYMQNWPKCTGKKFKDLAPHFKDAIVIGVKTGKGQINLNPAGVYTVQEDDEIIVIAEDDDTYEYADAEAPDGGVMPERKQKDKTPEHVLMTGWRRDIRDILLLLDTFVAKGTEIHMMAMKPSDTRDESLKAEGFDPATLKNMTLVHHEGNSSNRLDLGMLDIKTFTSVMVLADESYEDDIMTSDSHNLSTLLTLRAVQKEVFGPGKSLPPVITEILDPRTQQTIATGHTVFTGSDFVQSNQMISQMLAMICEDSGVRLILEELLGSHGSDISLEHAQDYALPNEQLSFLQLAMRVQKNKEVLCGYADKWEIMKGGQGTGEYEDEVWVNPRDKYTPRNWAEKPTRRGARGQEQRLAECSLIVLKPPPPPGEEELARIAKEGDGGPKLPLGQRPMTDFERLSEIGARVGRIETQMANLKHIISKKKHSSRSSVESLSAGTSVGGPSRSAIEGR